MAKHKQSKNLATAEIISKLEQLTALLDGNTDEVMRGIAGILEADVEDAFENERNPSTHEKWIRLDAATIKQRKAKGKWPGRKLQVKGELVGSLTSDYGARFARVGVGTDYAAAHQFGRPDKNIPARPYLPFDGLHPDTEQKILKLLDEKIAAVFIS